MKRSLLVPLLLGLLFALALVAVGVLRDDEDDTVEIAGMSVERAELQELTHESMGVDHLEDLPLGSHERSRSDEFGKLEDGVRSFELTARPVRWEYREGQEVAAWGFDGQVPGPTLRATEGERVRVEITNELPVATTVHWHGLDVPWTEDGVPGITQEAIEPGDTYTYEFTATPAGTRWYHTHGARMGDEAAPLDMGLYGAFVVAPEGGEQQPKPDVDQVLVLDEWNVAADGVNVAMLGGHAGHAGESNVFTINGLAMPSTEQLVVKRGERVRLRFVNASSRSYHPMHLHGHQFRIVALDGNPVATPIERNVVLLAPGETADVEFVANNPGVWLIHCHDLHHADAGMGMVLRYEGFDPVDEDELGGHAHGSDEDES